MARYFFHVMDGQASIDDVGVELADMAAVRTEAITTAGQMLSTGLESWTGDAWQMFVADADEKVVFSLRFTADHHGN
jgi:hypothetical protein